MAQSTESFIREYVTRREYRKSVDDAVGTLVHDADVDFDLDLAWFKQNRSALMSFSIILRRSTESVLRHHYRTALAVSREEDFSSLILRFMDNTALPISRDARSALMLNFYSFCIINIESRGDQSILFPALRSDLATHLISQRIKTFDGRLLALVFFNNTVKWLDDVDFAVERDAATIYDLFYCRNSDPGAVHSVRCDYSKLEMLLNAT